MAPKFPSSVVGPPVSWPNEVGHKYFDELLCDSFSLHLLLPGIALPRFAALVMSSFGEIFKSFVELFIVRYGAFSCYEYH